MLEVQNLPYVIVLVIIIIILGLFHRSVYETVCQPLAWISQLLLGCRDELQRAAQIVSAWAARALLQEGIEGSGMLVARIFGSFLLTAFCIIFVLTGADLFAKFVSDDAGLRVRQLVGALAPSLTPEFLASSSVVIAAVQWGIIGLDTMGVHQLTGFSRTSLSRRIFGVLAIANLIAILFLEVTSGVMRGMIFAASTDEPSTMPTWLGASLWGAHGFVMMCSAAASGFGAASLWVLSVWLLSVIAVFLLTLARAIAAIIVIVWNAASHAVLQALALVLRIAKLLVTPLALWLEVRVDGLDWRQAVGNHQQPAAPAPPNEPAAPARESAGSASDAAAPPQSANWDGPAGVNDNATTANQQKTSNQR